MNQLSTEAALEQRSFMVYVERDDKGGAEEAEGRVRGYCAPYNGAVCRNYIVGRGLVWFNISQDNAGGWRNEEITLAIKQELVDTLQEPCRAAAEAMLCHYAFPDCSIKAGEAAGLPLCYEDCVAIKYELNNLNVASLLFVISFPGKCFATPSGRSCSSSGRRGSQ